MSTKRSAAATTAVEFAIALVAARSWPQKKLREKVGARYDADEADAAIARMRELGMVNDEAWAERFARERFERGGKGRHRIRAELLARGIEAATADAALDRAFGGDAEREKAAAVLATLRARMSRTGPADDAAEGSDDAFEPDATTAAERRQAAGALKNRLFRRMLARGYPASVVRDLLDVS